MQRDRNLSLFLDQISFRCDWLEPKTFHQLRFQKWQNFTEGCLGESSNIDFLLVREETYLWLWTDYIPYFLKRKPSGTLSLNHQGFSILFYVNNSWWRSFKNKLAHKMSASSQTVWLIRVGSFFLSWTHDSAKEVILWGESILWPVHSKSFSGNWFLDFFEMIRALRDRGW